MPSGMRLITALCVLVGCTVAQLTVEEKIAGLQKGEKQNGVFAMSDNDFDELVFTRPRTFTVFAMTTRLSPQANCVPCQELASEFRLVQQAYARANPEEVKAGKVFFVFVDTDTSPRTFQKLTGVKPQLELFRITPDTRRVPKGDDKFGLGGKNAEQIARWVSDSTGLKVEIRRPIDKTKFVINMSILIAVVLAIRFASGVNFFKTHIFWGLVVMAFVCLMTSGHMWNTIRKPPPMGRGQFVNPSTQGQFLNETYWVFIMYFLFSCGVILMGDISVNYAGTMAKKTSYSILGAVLYVIFLSSAVNTYKQKQRGYPYSAFYPW